ncbi:MAG: glyoxalase superfamily protein, partial [Alphaproteobacteria bacterium]
MRTFEDAKAMAKSLRQALRQKNIEISHSEGLELVAAGFGFDNWNVLAARIE